MSLGSSGRGCRTRWLLILNIPCCCCVKWSVGGIGIYGTIDAPLKITSFDELQFLYVLSGCFVLLLLPRYYG